MRQAALDCSIALHLPQGVAGHICHTLSRDVVFAPCSRSLAAAPPPAREKSMET